MPVSISRCQAGKKEKGATKRFYAEETVGVSIEGGRSIARYGEVWRGTRIKELGEGEPGNG